LSNTIGNHGSFEVDQTDEFNPESLSDKVFELTAFDKGILGAKIYARATSIEKVHGTSRYRVMFEVVERPN
jgi:hypothetical protein